MTKKDDVAVFDLHTPRQQRLYEALEAEIDSQLDGHLTYIEIVGVLEMLKSAYILEELEDYVE